MMMYYILLSLLFCIPSSFGREAGQITRIKVTNKDGKVDRFWAESAFGKFPSRFDGLYGENENEAKDLLLVYDESNRFGCKNSTENILLPDGEENNLALVVDRGDCSFNEKYDNAFNLYNAKVIFVVNTVDSLYNDTTGYFFQPCSTNCLVSEDMSEEKCLENCPSNYCARNPRNANDKPFCCVLDSSTKMFVNETVEPVLPIFVRLSNGDPLVEAAKAGTGKVSIYLTAEESSPNWNGSMFLMLLWGTAVTVLASYRASQKERLEASWLWKKDRITSDSGNTNQALATGNGNKRGEDDDIEQLDLNASAIACFLVFCTGALVGMFFLAQAYPQQVVIVIQIIFGLSAIYALSHFVIQPIFRLLIWKNASKHKLIIREKVIGNYEEIIGTILSFSIVVWWFVARHQDYAWFLLDILGASVCCMFLVSVRLPNLKLGCFMMLLFFIYDIFMVFISPSLFGGRSVMLEVATAGKSVATVQTDVCERTTPERMPMLFLIPEIGNPSNYKLLGLGDIFIPGLLITFACRFDYLKVQKRAKPTTWLRTHQYFIPLGLSYFLGLLTAMIGVTLQWDFGTGVKGQPALLYLVPFTSLTFLLLAFIRRDFNELWHHSYEELYLKLKSTTHSSDNEEEEEEEEEN